MASLKVCNVVFFRHQKLPFKSVKWLESLRPSSSMVLTEPESTPASEKKLLKVAIVGRPNAGKSTLINKILKLNICGVSQKCHTTRTLFKVSFTENDTQIVFLDTPGLVTKKEVHRFDLPGTFRRATDRNVLNKVDMIGVIHEVRGADDLLKFPLDLTQGINGFTESKPLFLILNKIDLITDKSVLSAAKKLSKRTEGDVNKSTFLQNFSKIFLTSAIRNEGVREIVNYLVQQAKPGPWLFEADQSFDTSLNTVVLEQLRAYFMEYFPHKMPHYCKYEVEYLKENDLGEIICVCLVTCSQARFTSFIISRKNSLRSLCEKLESNIFKITGKVFRIRVVVQTSKIKKWKKKL